MVWGETLTKGTRGVTGGGKDSPNAFNKTEEIEFCAIIYYGRANYPPR